MELEPLDFSSTTNQCKTYAQHVQYTLQTICPIEYSKQKKETRGIYTEKTTKEKRKTVGLHLAAEPGPTTAPDEHHR